MRVWLARMLLVGAGAAVVVGCSSRGTAPTPPVRTTAVQTTAATTTVPSAPATASIAPTGVQQVDPAQPRQQQPLCCCRYFNQRWQTAWMTPPACAQVSGTCVSPDNC